MQKRKLKAKMTWERPSYKTWEFLLWPCFSWHELSVTAQTFRRLSEVEASENKG